MEYFYWEKEVKANRCIIERSRYKMKFCLRFRGRLQYQNVMLANTLWVLSVKVAWKDVCFVSKLIFVKSVLRESKK